MNDQLVATNRSIDALKTSANEIAANSRDSASQITSCERATSFGYSCFTIRDSLFALFRSHPEMATKLDANIHSLALVETDLVGAGSTIHAFAVIREGAALGKNVVIHPHCVIEAGVILGNNVEVFAGAVLGRVPGGNALARKPEFRRVVEIGNDCSIGPHAIIYSDVEIESGCLIGDAASIREQCRIGANSVIGRHVTLNYAIRIGQRVKIMDHTWLAGNMSVGNDAFISGHVATANDNAIGRAGYAEASIQGPIIGAGAMIGVGAVLLPGVVIGDRAIVGAASLVTRNVDPETLVLGIPARPIEREA